MVLLCYESDTDNAMPGSARLVALCAMLCLLRYVLCAMCYAMLCLCEVLRSRFWLKSFRAALADLHMAAKPLPRPPWRPFPPGLLHVCDIHPAAGEEYMNNLQWCRDHGVVVHSKPVNLFDYKHMLGSDDDFDLVIGFGLCFGTFCGANNVSRWKKTDLPREPPIRESSVEQRQYSHLWNRWKGAPSVQQTFNEALMGQNLRTTHIMIHESHLVKGLSPHAIHFPTFVARMYNPLGPRHLTQKMGHELVPSGNPMMAAVTGPGSEVASTHLRETFHQERQLDVQSMILTTLNANRRVLIVGAGEMRLLPTLSHSYPRPGGMPVVTPDIPRKFCIAKKIGGKKRSYFEYVLTEGHSNGTAPHDDSVVGRVNLKRLRLWTDCRYAGCKDESALPNRNSSQNM